MNRLKYFSAAAVVGFCFLTFTPKANAQVSFGVQIGSEPACPYGYYDYAPYQCAPYGYYGPEWFSNGAFIGTGPWYHGHDRFRGHVDRRYDPRFGYRGEYPNRGERGDWDRHHGTVEGFRGRDMREEHARSGDRGNYSGDPGNYSNDRGNHDRGGNGHGRDDDGHERH